MKRIEPSKAGIKRRIEIIARAKKEIRATERQLRRGLAALERVPPHRPSG
jgi:hypothetical protein